MQLPKQFLGISLLLAVFLVSACRDDATVPNSEDENGTVGSASQNWVINPGNDLNVFFECLEAEAISLVSAHRAGPYPGLPENALETAQSLNRQIPALYEIDIATSADGVLFLLHDDTLDRTTTGEGPFTELSWREISALKRVDNDGRETGLSPTRLEDFLAWAKGRALVQIDFKRSTRYKDVISLVRKTGTQDRVIYIAYTLAQARKLHSLAPEAMISVAVNSASELNSVVAAGLPVDRVIAFTGTRDPKPRLFSILNGRDIEVIFGTLGGRDSIDAGIDAGDDPVLYTELSRNGVDIIATDRPLETHTQLQKTGHAVPDSGICGIDRKAD